MDQAEHYFQLVMLGREAFLRQAAPAALVRRRADISTDDELGVNVDAEETLVASVNGALSGMIAATGNLQIYPLAKKRGAPFADMITLGRTPNNDIVIDDITVSRFHAFFRQKNSAWVVSDSGSKNGTRLDGVRLEPRKERELQSGDPVRMGDVETTFYLSTDLFDILSGSGS